jgi:inhibitor of cysteine peptidase
MVKDETVRFVACVVALCVFIAALAYVSDKKVEVVYYPVQQGPRGNPVLPIPSVVWNPGSSDERTRSGFGAIDIAPGGAELPEGLERFASFEEMSEYIGNSVGYGSGGGEMDQILVSDPGRVQPVPTMGSSTSFTWGNSQGLDGADMSTSYDVGKTDYYSTTNVQIGGVDEGDMLKNDGEYAYLVAESGHSVYALRVSPAENASIIGELTFGGTVKELYLKGNMLVVLEQAYYFEGGYCGENNVYSNEPITIISIFRTEDGWPVLEKSVQMNGMHVTSRQVADYLYVIGELSLANVDNETELPTRAENIYHIDGDNSRYTMTEFMALKLNDDDGVPSVLHVVMASSNNVLFTHKNIYITYTTSSSTINGWSQATKVHRLSIDRDEVLYAATGEFEGRLLNRYSMDEHAGHFRAATTVSGSNSVHVLDMNLSVVGELDDIAPGETIYSARFVGNKAYVVTFKKVDPLFVIDLAKPEHPKVLGQLKIPGYSTYLHPYDEDHIIGIGKDTVDAEGGQFAWYQGVKVSLFDVSNASAPKEVDSIVVGERGSESEALSDPHAFLFDPARSLLVMPMTVYPNDYSYYGHSEYWYGAYVFNITPENGISTVGRISHNTEAVQTGYDEGYYRTNYNPVKRSFYIGDVVYTVSQTMLKGNSFTDMSELCEVEFPVQTG